MNAEVNSRQYSISTISNKNGCCHLTMVSSRNCLPWILVVVFYLLLGNVQIFDMISCILLPPVEGNQVSAPPGSLASALYSVGLKDMNLNDDGCELAATLHSLLTGNPIPP